jgi:hypothetical protein
MNSSRLSKFGAGIIMTSLAACSSVPNPTSPARVVLEAGERTLPVRSNVPENNGRFLHGGHSHMFPKKWVGDTETSAFLHLPVGHREKLKYLDLRRDYLKTLLGTFRKNISETLQIKYELELRMIPDEMRRLRNELRRALERLKCKEGTEEI